GSRGCPESISGDKFIQVHDGPRYHYPSRRLASTCTLEYLWTSELCCRIRLLPVVLHHLIEQVKEHIYFSSGRIACETDAKGVADAIGWGAGSFAGDTPRQSLRAFDEYLVVQKRQCLKWGIGMFAAGAAHIRIRLVKGHEHRIGTRSLKPGV